MTASKRADAISLDTRLLGRSVQILYDSHLWAAGVANVMMGGAADETVAPMKLTCRRSGVSCRLYQHIIDVRIREIKSD